MMKLGKYPDDHLHDIYIYTKGVVERRAEDDFELREMVLNLWNDMFDGDSEDLRDWMIEKIHYMVQREIADRVVFKHRR